MCLKRVTFNLSIEYALNGDTGKYHPAAAAPG